MLSIVTLFILMIKKISSIFVVFLLLFNAVTMYPTDLMNPSDLINSSDLINPMGKLYYSAPDAQYILNGLGASLVAFALTGYFVVKSGFLAKKIAQYVPFLELVISHYFKVPHMAAKYIAKKLFVDRLGKCLVRPISKRAARIGKLCLWIGAGFFLITLPPERYLDTEDSVDSVFSKVFYAGQQAGGLSTVDRKIDTLGSDSSKEALRVGSISPLSLGVDGSEANTVLPAQVLQMHPDADVSMVDSSLRLQQASVVEQSGSLVNSVGVPVTAISNDKAIVAMVHLPISTTAKKVSNDKKAMVSIVRSIGKMHTGIIMKFVPSGMGTLAFLALLVKNRQFLQLF